MKAFAILAATLAAAFSAPSNAATLEELNSHLFTNTAVVWQTPTNVLPKSIWVYQRMLPRVFSGTIIAHAFALGSLQGRTVPKASANDFYIWEDKGSNYPGPISSIFALRPGDAYLEYSKPNYATGSSNDIPGDKIIVEQAWKYAQQLGLDPSKLIQRNLFNHLCTEGPRGEEVTGYICGRGVFLARQLDGISFFSAGEDGEGAEGFLIEFGSGGKIRDFCLRWSDVARYQNQPTASFQQITRCIVAHKIFVVPNYNEENYFARLRALARAKKLTIKRITPYYNNGVFGEMPTYDVPCKFTIPFAELEAEADLGNTNATVRLVSPILSSEVSRVLRK